MSDLSAACWSLASSLCYNHITEQRILSQLASSVLRLWFKDKKQIFSFEIFLGKVFLEENMGLMIFTDECTQVSCNSCKKVDCHNCNHVWLTPPRMQRLFPATKTHGSIDHTSDCGLFKMNYSSYIVRRPQKVLKIDHFWFDRLEFSLQFEMGVGWYVCVD